MIKNHRSRDVFTTYLNLGQPHPSRTLAASRLILQSAKRRARIPAVTLFYIGPFCRWKCGSSRANILPHPRSLSRGCLLKVDPKVIYELEPGFTGMSIDIIRSGEYSGHTYVLLSISLSVYLKCSRSYFGALRTFHAEPPLAVIPKEMEWVCDDRTLATCPTHFLAVYRSTSLELTVRLPKIQWNLNYRREVIIFPIHTLPLFLHCLRLPPIPESKPEITTFREGDDEKKPMSIIKLPVIPLALPYPQVFPLMLQFFYSYNSLQLCINLVPIPYPAVAGWSDRKRNLAHAANIANNFDVPAIQQIRNRIWMVHQNACILQVAIDTMWNPLISCWNATFCAESLIERKREMEIAEKKDLSKFMWIVEGNDNTEIQFLVVPKPEPVLRVEATTQTPSSSPSSPPVASPPDEDPTTASGPDSATASGSDPVTTSGSQS